MRCSGCGRFSEAQLAACLGLGAFDGQQRDGRDDRQSDFLGSKLFKFGFDVRFLEQVRSHFCRIVNHDIIYAVAREEKQVEQIIHALGVLAGKQEKGEPDALGGE